MSGRNRPGKDEREVNRQLERLCVERKFAEAEKLAREQLEARRMRALEYAARTRNK